MLLDALMVFLSLTEDVHDSKSEQDSRSVFHVPLLASGVLLSVSRGQCGFIPSARIASGSTLLMVSFLLSYSSWEQGPAVYTNMPELSNQHPTDYSAHMCLKISMTFENPSQISLGEYRLMPIWGQLLHWWHEHHIFIIKETFCMFCVYETLCPFHTVTTTVGHQKNGHNHGNTDYIVIIIIFIWRPA